MHAPHLLGETGLSHPGEKIPATLDLDIQQKVVSLASQHHGHLQHNEIHNIACVVMETLSGDVLAYVGNIHIPGGASEHGNDVDIIHAPRSTGSILKPVLFALMLEEGDILPGTLVPDIPTQYTGYSPKNFSLTYNGVVPARRALARSLNIPAVRMLQHYGLERFHYYLPRLGFSTLNHPPDHYGLSLILGGAEGTLWEITGLYASMGRILQNYNMHHGYDFRDIRPPNYLAGISPAAASPLEDKERIPLSAGSIWLTFQSLIEVNRPETERGWQGFASSGNIAWKTGTSFGFRDGWAIGTTPEFTVGVWAGNADGEGRPGLTGIAAAAPLLFDVFGILPQTSWFHIPVDDVYPVEVCRQSGHLPGPYCQDLDTILAGINGLRSSPCPYHILAHLSPDGRYRVNDNCMEPHKMRHESWFVLPPVQEWYFRTHDPSYRVLPELHPDCASYETVAFMDLIYPRHSARVYVPYELDGTRGELVLEAAHRDPSSTIHWHLDEEYLGSTNHLHQLGIVPARGWHTLVLVDENGNSLEHRFEVIDR
jgi:penicillin-binding protein 1C